MIDRTKYLSENNWLSEPRIICGLMSGTSLDGVDAALCKFWIDGTIHRYELLHFFYLPFDSLIKGKINKIISGSIAISELSELNFILAEYYSFAIKELLRVSGFNGNIDLIGMHGQTVWHSISDNKNQRLTEQHISSFITSTGDEIKSISNTLQIGSAGALATWTKIPVISDFRSADVALGGQGAPLVPIFDKVFLSDNHKDVIALNIGGISNITYLPQNGKVLAFDTGPGNCLIDTAVKTHFNLDYDANGEIAYRGRLIPEVFEEMKKIDYIGSTPPKSTGRELFNSKIIIDIFKKLRIIPKSEDLIHTLSKFTAWSVGENIRLFANPKSKIIVSGGGARNNFIFENIKIDLPEADIITSDEAGIDSSAKEAICFAYLAYRNLANLPGNIISVTGAEREAILGSLTFPA